MCNEVELSQRLSDLVRVNFSLDFVTVRFLIAPCVDQVLGAKTWEIYQNLRLARTQRAGLDKLPDRNPGPRDAGSATTDATSLLDPWGDTRSRPERPFFTFKHSDSAGLEVIRKCFHLGFLDTYYLSDLLC